MVVVTAWIIGVTLKRHVAAGLVRAESALWRSARSRTSFVHLNCEIIRADIVTEANVTQECGVLLISVLEVTNCFRHTATYAFKLLLHVYGLALAMQTVDAFSVVN